MTPQTDQAKAAIGQQHDAIIDCCSILLSHLRADASIDEIGKARMQLARLLHENVIAEEAAINGPIRRLSIAERPLHFVELGAEAGDLRRRYTDHVGYWSMPEIIKDREGYAASVTALVVEVTGHLGRKKAAFPRWWQAIAHIGKGLNRGRGL